MAIRLSRQRLPCLRILVISSLVLWMGFFPLVVVAAKGTHAAPKLLNLYLGWQIKDNDQPALSRWDLVVLDMDMQWQAPEKIRQLRQANPGLKIIAYISSSELADARAQGDHASPGYHLSELASEQLFMHKANGQRLSWWPGAHLLNATDAGSVNGQRWNQALPNFVKNEMMSTGLWDGVFLDAAYSDITSFFGNDIDPDGDGKANPPAEVNVAWRAGMTKLLRNMRSALGPDKLILSNSSPYYASEVNGVLFENFPRYGWTGPFKDIRDSVGKNARPSITSINTNTNNQESPGDYRLMRYGLGSALLADSYYSFDAGDRGHERTWWYDEYDASLGAPTKSLRLVSGTGSGPYPGVWWREYEQGLVLVNSDSVPRKVELPGTFERLHGHQDPSTNNGSLVRSVTVPAQDALLLLGKAETTDIVGSAFINGVFVRAYTADGQPVKNGFFAQQPGVPGGVPTLIADLGQNGVEQTVSASNGTVTVAPVGGTPVQFRPFGPGYRGALSVAVGNTNRDSALEIVVGRDRSKTPDVAVYSRTGVKLRQWLAYTPQFSGGVRVAVGDLDGDGLREIVTGPGPGGGPHIRIFKTDGNVWGGSFFAFPPQENGGVSVAVGDVDGDKRDDIIVGSGVGAVPRVRVFDFRGTLKHEFAVGTRPLLNGLTVSVADTDGNGVQEIIVGGVSAF